MIWRMIPSHAIEINHKASELRQRHVCTFFFLLFLVLVHEPMRFGVCKLRVQRRLKWYKFCLCCVPVISYMGQQLNEYAEYKIELVVHVHEESSGQRYIYFRFNHNTLDAWYSHTSLLCLCLFGCFGSFNLFACPFFSLSLSLFPMCPHF